MRHDDSNSAKIGNLIGTILPRPLSGGRWQLPMTADRNIVGLIRGGF